MARDQYPSTGDSVASGIWPFLVGSGRTVGQRVILAPEFLLADKSSALLLKAVGSAQVTRSDSRGTVAWRRHVQGGHAGDFIVIFRMIRVRSELVGKAGGDLLDSASRPVYLSEGVVLKDAHASITESVLGQAHDISVLAFREFWEADNRFAQPVASRPLPRPEPARGGSALVAIELPAIPGREEVAAGVAGSGPGESQQGEQGEQGEQSAGASQITIGPGIFIVIAVVIAIAIAIYFLVAA
jgi:hypothetical protein